MLTAERLRAALDYDPATGLFRWIERPNQKIIVGSIAGHVGRKGYIYVTIDKRKYAAHRLAWLYVNGEWPKEQIDHINRVKDDNRISNLRDVSDAENKLNIDYSKVLRAANGRFAVAA